MSISDWIRQLLVIVNSSKFGTFQVYTVYYNKHDKETVFKNVCNPINIDIFIAEMR